MKNLISSFAHRLSISLMCMFLVFQASAQSEQPESLYARLLYFKVDQQEVGNYVKIMNEEIKPALQQAKIDGAIAAAGIYQVHYTGANSEYNFVTVLLQNSWEKTEKLPSLAEILKKAHPNKDPQVTIKKLNDMRHLARQELYSRIDFVNPPEPVMYKYIMVNFMKPKPGVESEYLTLEREVWKPIHKELVSSGVNAGWSLLSLTIPIGDVREYDYVTINSFTDYSKINNVPYETTAQRLYAGTDINTFITNTLNKRDMVKGDLWELIMAVE